MNGFEIDKDKLVQCSLTGDVAVPKGVKIIGSGSITERVKTVTFPEGVETIEGCAIRRLYMVTVYLPKSLKKIESNAFSSIHETTKIVYNGTAEDFMKIKISTTGNRDFIKLMEAQLGLESRFGAKKPTTKDTTSVSTKNKKEQLKEWISTLEKEYKIERIDVKERLKSWNSVIGEYGGLFRMQDMKAILPIGSSETISAECARRVGKMQSKIALDDKCFAVNLKYYGDVEANAKKILFENSEPKWQKIDAIAYRKIPIETLNITRCSDGVAPRIEDGKVVLGLSTDRIEHYYVKDEDFPKDGVVTIPLRIRILDKLPNFLKDDICGIRRSQPDITTKIDKYYIVESDTHNYKQYFYYGFSIQGKVYEFCFMPFEHWGSSYVSDYSIGKDECGYYVDMLFSMSVKIARGE